MQVKRLRELFAMKSRRRAAAAASGARNAR
jgi:hypothetical protein